MCWGDVQLMKDADGTEHLHFSERQTKISGGANHLMSDRSNLELSRLQIHRSNEILKRDQTP